MPAPIVLSTLTPELKKVVNPPEGQPVIATKAEFRDGSRPPPPPAGLIFQDNFDDQPDWTSTMHTTASAQQVSTGHTLPVGWDSIYQGTEWSPETGFPDNHASLEILASNTDKARGGTGKSMVHWRESNSRGTDYNWASDSQTVKVLDQQYSQLYVEFWIAFSDNWEARTSTEGWMSKIFRVGSWDGEGDIFNGGQGAIGPIFFWDYLRGQNGLLNKHVYRGGPWGENYMMDSSDPSYPKDDSMNFTSMTLGQAPGGTDPLLVDQVNGGFLKDIDRYDFIDHDQLFGTTSQHWTKVAFYVQMNSAPDATDGILKQWINDQRIVNITNIPWIKANTESKMVGWNYVALGGNDFFRPYPDTDRFEDWYAIDDLVVLNSIPAGGE